MYILIIFIIIIIVSIILSYLFLKYGVGEIPNSIIIPQIIKRKIRAKSKNSKITRKEAEKELDKLKNISKRLENYSIWEEEFEDEISVADPTKGHVYLLSERFPSLIIEYFDESIIKVKIKAKKGKIVIEKI